MNSEISSSPFSVKNELIVKELEEGIPVFLNVYHLTPANYVIQLVGFGFFHTTLELNNTEYSFGATKANISGIFYNKVGEGPKSITLKGSTIYNETIILQILQLYLPYWEGISYDPLMKNCNHFTKFLANKLLKSQKVNYPQYVNRIIDYGIWLNGFYSPIKRLYGNLACQPGDYIKVSNENGSENENNLNINNVDTVDVQICIAPSEIEESNRNNIGFEKHLRDKDGLFPDLPEDEEKFFVQCFESNQFLKPYKTNLGNSSFLNYLAIADDLFLNSNKFGKAIEIYQRLLNEVDSKNAIELKDFPNDFKPKNYSLSQPSNYPTESSEIDDIIILIKIKIMHCIQYHYFKEKQHQKQEGICNLILSLNKKDYYALFACAYIKYKENKFPECFQLLHSCLLDCTNEPYRLYLKHFLHIIDKIEFF